MQKSFIEMQKLDNKIKSVVEMQKSFIEMQKKLYRDAKIR